LTDRRNDVVDAESRTGGKGQLCPEYNGRTGTSMRPLSGDAAVASLYKSLLARY
jgi:hypothetical protein